MSFMQLWVQGLALVMGLLTVLWLISIPLKNVSVVDIFWGTGFVIINLFYFLHFADHSLRQWLMLALVTLWGLRLSVYLASRNLGKPEDYRYQQFRMRYGPQRYWWVSFFQVFVLQGVLIAIISVPLLAVQISDQVGLNGWDFAAIICWMVGFVFEAGGDYQLARFKSNPAMAGKVLDSGFWKYTRHPNYFGDAAVWWSYALFSIASGVYWPVLGSALMTFLLIKVSGVALLEKNLKERRPEYVEYIKNTPGFIPGIKWRKSSDTSV